MPTTAAAADAAIIIPTSDAVIAAGGRLAIEAEKALPGNPPGTPSSGKSTNDVETSGAESSPGDTPPASPEQQYHHDAAPAYSTARQTAIVVCATGASFLNTLTVQSCVIVLPAIGRDLGIAASRQQWVVSAYALAFGCFLLLFGKLADVYGRRRVYLAGSAALTGVTVAIPFLRDEVAFDVLRGLQGTAAAANVPTAIGILGTFPPGKTKNYAFAFYAGGAPMGAIFGNVLGGVLGQFASWRWIFWVLSIFAAMITVASYFVIPVPPPHQHGSKRSIDWIGAVLVTVGMLVLLFALTEGNVVGWSTPYIPALIVVSIVLIAAFVLWQVFLERRTARAPLMKVSLFASKRFSAAMLIMVFFFASFINFIVFVTFFYQSYQGLSEIQAALRFLPTCVVGLTTIFVIARILSRVKGNHILMYSTLCMAMSCLLMAVPIPPDTSYWASSFWPVMISILGVDSLFPTLALFVSMSLPPEDQALGGGLTNAVGQIGRSIGLAIATAIEIGVIARLKHADVDDIGRAETQVRDPALLEGLRAAQWFSFGMAMAAFAVVVFAFRDAGIIGRR